MHGLLRCNINAGVHARTQSRRVTQRCHNSPTWETGLHNANDVTHRKRAENFGRFWKTQLVEMRPASGEDGWFSLAHGNLCGGCHTCWGGGGRWKSQNRKIVPLSPYVEEPLNSKVIKKFRSWTKKSRSVFFFFFFFCVSRFLGQSLWTFDVRLTHSHIMAMVQSAFEL